MFFRIRRSEPYDIGYIPIFQEMPMLSGDAWTCKKHNKIVNVCKSVACKYWGMCGYAIAIEPGVV